MFVIRKNKGFTIVELTAVIVVISILVAISIVSYVGISSRAIQASVRTDLDNVTKQIKQYQGTLGNGKYPGSVTDCPNPANGNICLKPSGSNKLSYKVYNTTKPKDFRITAYNEGQGIYYSNNASDIKCPLNFVIVPGSNLYGTKDFCVMKYEAKQASPTVPISLATGLPWVNVPQNMNNPNNDAIDFSKNTADCSNCHLITEAEWMTIAHDVLGVDSNVMSLSGYEYIYRGNSVNLSGSGPLEASKKDSEGYAGMNSTHAGDGTFVDDSHLYVTGDSQRRTLTLSNGEVIWDLAGNVSEWTAGHLDANIAIAPAQTLPTPKVCNASDGSTFAEWPDVNIYGSLPVNPLPRAMTDYSVYGSAWWDSTSGIGSLCSNSSATYGRSFIRGGNWVNGLISGVLSLTIFESDRNYTDSNGSEYVGFRVAR